MKRIPNTNILSVVGKPYLVPKRDDDGEIEWEDEAKQIPVSEPATTTSLLRMIILSLPKSMQAQNDGRYAHQLWNDILKADDGYIEVHDKVYSWIGRLFSRHIPLSKESKESGAFTRTLACEYFGTSDYTILQQLRDPDDRDSNSPDSLPDV